MITDTVIRKLAAIGLTLENIKKLENLTEEPPFGGIDKGSQPANATDAVLSKLKDIGLIEKNIKKLIALKKGPLSFTIGKGL